MRMQSVTRLKAMLFVLSAFLLSVYNVKILISEGRNLKGYQHPMTSAPITRRSYYYENIFKGNDKNVKSGVLGMRRRGNYYCVTNIKNWTENIKKLINKYGSSQSNKEEKIAIHPLKNCRWEITTYNFFLQKNSSFFIHIYDNGKVKTSDNMEGTWFYNNYYLTWFIEYDNRRIYYTAELLWNGDKSKLTKGIIYEEKKKRRFFLPSYFFRKVLGSFDGKIVN
ncbi:hypothetical protein, conserved [Plasmodium gonderi]|uniref:Uncharacterized protein n=1 Tax=Plasmodium gonderi TaxID=77519 RepID=A0A1Y1JPC1_PLAGO|nr:hypothetical protein, conserved [Plasmodium gonderi]GAW82263.1 hypothetical protein, conserved [Plasmodium gonderi]